jgi:pimeloyl-ACP methyl ester carboxylesterase
VSIEENVQYNSFPNLCDNVDPSYLAHVNTPVLARDFEMVRSLAGAETFNCFAWGEGSKIGVAYAALFPEHVGRVVLDGASLLVSLMHL